MSRIAVIDHGAGNLVSIAQGLRAAGAHPVIVTDPSELDDVAGIVLPGVGTTGAAMERLTAEGLVEPLQATTLPLLGICVGLQLFFDRSAEADNHCLGMVPGTVERLDAAPLLPHIGWNDIDVAPDPIFAGVTSGSTVYFVHSYVPVPGDASTVIATAEYGQRFVAAVRSGNRVGVQFHPERSGVTGRRILANFVAACEEASRAA